MLSQRAGPIRGIPFDSGDTLVRPIDGAWFPGRHFRRILHPHGLTNLHWDQLDSAIRREGDRFFLPNAFVQTEEEEPDLFAPFYTALLRSLGHAPSDDDLARAIARANLDDVQIEPFPDSLPTIQCLHARSLRLAVISNAWPSLERRFRLLGLRDFFNPFVISTWVGASKPDPAIFRHAIDALGLPPESLLFVDDSPDNVEAAIHLGLRRVVVVRRDQKPPSALPWIGSLAQLESLLP